MTDKMSLEGTRVASDTVMDGNVDEAELARMGYKQELKWVVLSRACRLSTDGLSRRDLGLLQVCLVSIHYCCSCN